MYAVSRLLDVDKLLFVTSGIGELTMCDLFQVGLLFSRVNYFCLVGLVVLIEFLCVFPHAIADLSVLVIRSGNNFVVIIIV